MICENCGKEHSGLYGSGRFCSSYCAKSFSTKYDNKLEVKKFTCINCGSDIYVNKHSSLIKYCCNCSKKEKLKSEYSVTRVKKCKICGSKYYSGDKCKNIFCNTLSSKGFKLLIDYFGFDKAKLGTAEVEDEYNRIRNILYDLYWKNKLSAKEIADKFNFKSKHSISQTVFKFLNIPTRTFKEATKNAYNTGRKIESECENQYKTEYHTTWNNKVFFLRSSYESDYANELDKQKILYEVENLKIKYFNTKINDYSITIPDFYLPETNTIVEIKSTWTLDIQEMKDKVKAYKDLGYNFKLILNHEEVDLYSLDENKFVKTKFKSYSVYKILGSAYGTCWIYNDKESKKIKKEDLDKYLSEGWNKGRKMKFE